MRVRRVTFTFDGVSTSRLRAWSFAVQTLRHLSMSVDGPQRTTKSAQVDVTAAAPSVESDVKTLQRTAVAVKRRLVRGSD
jgi:hypothetical protein